jgi:Glyoxalase/Bleomycin resistance protein/Dioxygenase superfamily
MPPIAMDEAAMNASSPFTPTDQTWSIRSAAMAGVPSRLHLEEPPLLPSAPAWCAGTRLDLGRLARRLSTVGPAGHGSSARHVQRSHNHMAEDTSTQRLEPQRAPGLGRYLQGVQHVSVTVDDWAKSLEFYIDVLGGNRPSRETGSTATFTAGCCSTARGPMGSSWSSIR